VSVFLWPILRVAVGGISRKFNGRQGLESRHSQCECDFDPLRKFEIDRSVARLEALFTTTKERNAIRGRLCNTPVSTRARRLDDASKAQSVVHLDYGIRV
jgi:hypothetical protein